MIKYFLFFLVIGLVSCGIGDKYDPNDWLSADEKDKVVTSIVRYAAKAPKGVNNQAKFDASFDDYYQQRARELRLEQLFEDNGTYYFLLSQPAPSLEEKRTATGGKFTLDNNGDLNSYEEVFRTWKMTPDTLRRRSYFLFGKMVNGEALGNYYSSVTGDQYIEFPDSGTYFEIASREWKVKAKR